MCGCWALLLLVPTQQQHLHVHARDGGASFQEPVAATHLFCGSAPLLVANSASFPLYSVPFRLGEDPQNSISWHLLSSGVV